MANSWEEDGNEDSFSQRLDADHDDDHYTVCIEPNLWKTLFNKHFAERIRRHHCLVRGVSSSLPPCLIPKHINQYYHNRSYDMKIDDSSRYWAVEKRG